MLLLTHTWSYIASFMQSLNKYPSKGGKGKTNKTVQNKFFSREAPATSLFMPWELKCSKSPPALERRQMNAMRKALVHARRFFYKQHNNILLATKVQLFALIAEKWKANSNAGFIVHWVSIFADSIIPAASRVMSKCCANSTRPPHLSFVVGNEFFIRILQLLMNFYMEHTS